MMADSPSILVSPEASPRVAGTDMDPKKPVSTIEPDTIASYASPKQGGAYLSNYSAEMFKRA